MPLNWIKEIDKVDIRTLLLLEACQIGWIDENRLESEWSAIFHAHPDIAWTFEHKAPAKSDWIRRVMTFQPSGKPIRDVEVQILRSVEDWIVYAINPEIYARQPFTGWDERELTGMTDFAGKRVIDIGSGTGKQLFALAPLCRAIYAVEPVSSLRAYLREKAARLGFAQVYVVDGWMERLPFEDEFADVVVAGHVFGDDMPGEYADIMRVLKPGGMILLCPGNVDADNAQHTFLMERGFNHSVFEEPGDGLKRKYWHTKPL